MIPLFQMSVNHQDIDAMETVLCRTTQWADGPEVSQFEQKICDYMKAKYCVVFNSGTSALHATMLAYDIGEGDEVIVPSFTFIATANCVRMVGATPVFADIEDTTYGLDPDNVAVKITARTRAIICVHYAGCPCHVSELQKIARQHNLLLIEDAAEAMGAEIVGVKVGTIGDAGVLSFCQNKIITTGEGGAVVTNNEEIYRKLRLIRSQGRQEGDYFGAGAKLDYVQLGYNWRMPSINAALGISQLERIDELIVKRLLNAAAYEHTLPVFKEPCKNVQTMEFTEHVYQMYSIRCPDRDKLMGYLKANGISCGVWFHPVHKTKYYRDSGYTDVLPVTEKVSSEIISLPMYPDLKLEDVDYICQRVEEFYK